MVADAKKVWTVLYGVDEDSAFAKVARPPWATAPRAVLQPGESFTFAIPRQLLLLVLCVCRNKLTLFLST